MARRDFSPSCLPLVENQSCRTHMPTITTLTQTYSIQRTCSKCARQWRDDREMRASYISSIFDNSKQQQQSTEEGFVDDIKYSKQQDQALCPSCGGLASEIISQHFQRGIHETMRALLSAPLAKAVTGCSGALIGGAVAFLTLCICGMIDQKAGRGDVGIVSFIFVPAVLFLFFFLTRLFYRTWESARLAALENIAGLSEEDVESRITAACKKNSGDLPSLEKTSTIFWTRRFLPSGYTGLLFPHPPNKSCTPQRTLS
jgi:hypothetical protein